MMRTRMRRVIDGMLVAGLLVTAWRYFPAGRGNAETVPDWIDSGETLAPELMNSLQPSQHLVLAVRETCQACEAAMPQLRRLVGVARANDQRWFVTVVSSDEREALDSWLRANKLTPDRTLGGVNMRNIGFRATPTVLLAMPDGTVTDIIVGEMSPTDETMVSSRLRGQPGPAVVRNQYARAIDLGRADELVSAGATWVSVGERSSASSTLRAGALKIPFDEIADRAGAEVDLLRPILVDCTGVSLGKCERAAEDFLAAGALFVYLVPSYRGSWSP